MKKLMVFFCMVSILLGNCNKGEEMLEKEDEILENENQDIESISSVSKTGLIAYYPFNGDATDHSGNSLNGTVEGAQLTTDRHNSVNSAYLFSGDLDVIVVPDNNLFDVSKDLTISVWINLSSGNISGSRIVDKIVSGTGNGFLLDLYNITNDSEGITNSIRFIGQEGFTSISQQEVSMGEWTHIVSTYHSGIVRIYLNGVLVSETIESTQNLFDNEENLQIGNDIYGAGPAAFDPFRGKIDDIRIYNRILSSEEINILLME